MEYELFRSKLKPFVDGALIPGIIRRSSLGLNSHCTAAMELMIEGSIQERRERMFEKARDSPRSDPTPQAKSISVLPNTSIPEVQPLAPAPAPQLPSQSLPSAATGIVTSPASTSSKYNAPSDSPVLSKRAKGIEVAQSEKPLADVKTDPSPPKDFVELECEGCHLKRLRSLPWGVSCPGCFLTGSKSDTNRMKCVGCGTIWVGGVDACTGCHRKFE